MLKGVENIRYGFALFFVIVTYFIGMQGCSDDTPKLSGNYDITYDLLKTKIIIRFTDAKTGELLKYKGVNVTVNGEAKDAVVDISGLKHNSYKSVNGFMALALLPDEAYEPSESNPVRFLLEASLDGYFTASKSVTLTKSGTYQIRMTLAKKDNLPEGISQVYKTGLGNIVNDTLTGKVSVSTPGLEAHLIIPPKTVLLDKDSVPLSSPLKISLVYFDNGNDNTLSLFPGGILSSENRNGMVTDGMFSPACFVTLSITGNEGKKAVTFSNKKPVLEMLINADTYNPETNSEISAGDFVSVYNFDFETGMWNYQNNDTIFEYTGIPPVGEYVVTTEISTVSYHTVSWFSDNICYNGGKIMFNSDTVSTVKSGGFISGILRRTVDSSYICWLGSQTSQNDTLTINIAPAGVPVFVDWHTDSCSNILPVAQSNPLFIDNLCSPLVNVVAFNNANGFLNNVTVEMTGHCSSNPDIDIKPSFGLWYRSESQAGCWHWSDMKDGQSTLYNLTLGESCLVGTYIDGHWHEWSFTVDETFYFNIDFDFSSNICSGVFGM